MTDPARITDSECLYAVMAACGFVPCRVGPATGGVLSCRCCAEDLGGLQVFSPEEVMTALLEEAASDDAEWAVRLRGMAARVTRTATLDPDGVPRLVFPELPWTATLEAIEARLREEP